MDLRRLLETRICAILIPLLSNGVLLVVLHSGRVKRGKPETARIVLDISFLYKDTLLLRYMSWCNEEPRQPSNRDCQDGSPFSNAMTCFLDPSRQPLRECPAFHSPSLLFSAHHQRRKRAPVCVAVEPDSSHTTPGTKRSHIHSPVVHRYADESEESYAMWYTSHAPNSTASIQLATSSDGLSFTTIEGPHEGAVLSKNDEQWWAFDTKHVTLGDVVSGSSSRVRADGDVVFLYYAGTQGEYYFTDKFRPKSGRIGVALSKDGQHFSRIEGEFPSGAVLEGGESAFDELGVCAPCVTRVGNSIFMHYHTYSENDGYMLGMAVSKDGILFKKVGQVVLSEDTDSAKGGVLNACVVEDQRGYKMFVEVMSGTQSSIAVCESPNCETWGSLKQVLDGSEPGSEGVGTPCALPMPDGSLRLYYTRYTNGDSYLALAESEGTDWTKLKATTALDLQ